MVEDSRLGGPSRGAVVVTGDRVEELGQHRRIDVLRALLDHAQTEVNVSKEAPLFGLPERRTSSELSNPADVVQE